MPATRPTNMRLRPEDLAAIDRLRDLAAERTGIRPTVTMLVRDLVHAAARRIRTVHAPKVPVAPPDRPVG